MFEELQIPALLEGGALAAAIIAVAGAIGWWIKGMADRGRVQNEKTVITAKIDEDVRAEVALRFRELRQDILKLENKMQSLTRELNSSVAENSRRSAKTDMLIFALRTAMDELYAKDPKNKVLAQVRKLLERIEDEPHQAGNSNTLNAAEDTVDAANEAVREVKASEARND